MINHRKVGNYHDITNIHPVHPTLSYRYKSIQFFGIHKVLCKAGRVNGIFQLNKDKFKKKLFQEIKVN